MARRSIGRYVRRGGRPLPQIVGDHRRDAATEQVELLHQLDPVAHPHQFRAGEDAARLGEADQVGVSRLRDLGAESTFISLMRTSSVVPPAAVG